MPWDLEEFRDLCANRNLPDTTVYQVTLVSKGWRAHHFGARSQQVWTDLFSSQVEVVFGDEDWNRTTFESEAYIEAALQALHSMADVLAQIANVVILKSHFPEAQTSLQRVHQKLISQNVAPSVISAIEHMVDSAEFKYVNAFVNTVKHRRLLDAEFHAEFGEDARNEEGLRFKPFTYRQTRFQTMWLSDIVDNIIPCVIDSVSETGNALSDYLR